MGGLFATVGLILLAGIALMLWRIEQRLRPETYVLMQRDDKTNEMVFADALKEEYGTLAMAHAAAAALYLEDNDPVFIVSTKHRHAVDGVPTPPDPDSELLDPPKHQRNNGQQDQSHSSKEE